MSKTRACYNCLHYDQRGIDLMPIGDRPADLSNAELRTSSYAPRCLRGLNPALAHAPTNMAEREKGEFAGDEMASFCDSYLWAPLRYEKLRRVVRLRLQKHPNYTTCDLSEKFVPHYERNDRVRIKVQWGTNWTHTECGFVSLSTGWKPVFLLMRNHRARVRSTVLDDDYRIIGMKYDKEKRYRDFL